MRKASHQDRVAAARFRCTSSNAKGGLPYFRAITLSCTTVPIEGIGTAAVDKWGRMYYDPAFVDSIGMDELCFVVLHEVSHLAMGHHRRLRAILGREPDGAEAKLWNIAADLCINVILRDAGCTLVKGCVLPAMFGLEENLSTERYYELLRDKIKFVELPAYGDGAGNPAPGRGLGGSAADGVTKPWESPGPGEPGGDGPDVPAAISEFHQTLLSRQAAEDAIKAKQRGNIPAGLERWASAIIRPKVDPRKELLALVRHGLTQAAGMRDFTYSRPARRRPATNVVLPAMRTTVPRVTIIVDTSGSMSERDLGIGLGLIGSVIRALPDQGGVRVLAGDTRVAAARTVFRPEQVQLAGGGGTDMAHICREAMTERLKPQLVVILTDGFTPWPEPLGVPVVACLTPSGADSTAPPAWIKAVQLEEA